MVDCLLCALALDTGGELLQSHAAAVNELQQQRNSAISAARQGYPGVATHPFRRYLNTTQRGARLACDPDCRRWAQEHGLRV